MGNNVVTVHHITKVFNIYSRDIQKVKSVLFGMKPSEVLIALDDVSFTVTKGERIAIVGPVGSGRSTLLKILSDVTSPSRGRVSVPDSVNAMLHNRAGLEMEFSCQENVYLKANIVGLSKEIVDEHMDEILAFAEVQEFAELPMKRAPKGAPALMSLAVHLLKDSDLLLVDEVFGGGGGRIKTKCDQYLRKYLSENEDTTAIMVSNSIPYLKTFCTRAIVLDRGKLVFDGSLDEAGNIFKTLNK